MALALGACSLLQTDPVDEAREAYAAQDYNGARDLALAALQADAGNRDALELLAQIQIAMGLGADAIVTLDRLEETGGGPDDAAVIRAEALLQTGETRDALALLEGKDSAESWRLRALAAAQAGDHARAAQAFTNGHDAPGDRRKLFTAEASFHLGRGDANAARRPVGEAQRLSPGSIETLFVSARLAELDNRPDLASRAYLAILELAPNDRPAMLGAIRELDKLGRIDLVRQLVQRGLAAYPGDIEFIYFDASLYAFDGNWQATRDLLQQHEEAVAAHENSRGLYGQALLELGQLEQARAMIAPLNRRYPDNAAYARVYTRILLRLGEAGQARQVIGRIASRPQAQNIDRELAAQARRS